MQVAKRERERENEHAVKALSSWPMRKGTDEERKKIARVERKRDE